MPESESMQPPIILTEETAGACLDPWQASKALCNGSETRDG